MKTLRNILTLLILTSFLKVNGQTFDRSYQGWWATTSWIFHFKLDGTYERISDGHYGNTNVTGTYKVNSDTIQLLNGFEKTNGTVNEKYLIDNDSLIIDLELYYDYKLLTTETNFYNSKKRYDILKKPNMDSLIVVTRQQFDTIVQHCTSLLMTSRNVEIKDSDHINIIRLINTIDMSQDTSLKSGIYTEFMNLVKDKDYEKEISIYYDWIPNRGMGFYFQKLQVELGGTPHLYSRFTIE
jgi:hypothetical protein